MKFDANRLSEHLVAGDATQVVELTREALATGTSASDILENGLLPGMDVVGKKFKAFEMFIPEVLRSAKAMHAAMEILRPLLAAGGIPLAGTLVIGTVQGDLHDIGKNLVAMMFEGAGFTVVDLGVDVKPQDFVQAVSEHQATLLGMSALLTTTMPRMAETIEAVQAAGLRNQLKILVGGAPATPEFARAIGADAYAPNATVAVEKARELLM